MKLPNWNFIKVKPTNMGCREIPTALLPLKFIVLNGPCRRKATNQKEKHPRGCFVSIEEKKSKRISSRYGISFVPLLCRVLYCPLFVIFLILWVFSLGIESKGRSINIKSLPLTIMATQIELLSSYLSHYKLSSLQRGVYNFQIIVEPRSQLSN